MSHRLLLGSLLGFLMAPSLVNHRVVLHLRFFKSEVSFPLASGFRDREGGEEREDEVHKDQEEHERRDDQVLTLQ